jgi:hypothetical protein
MLKYWGARCRVQTFGVLEFGGYGGKGVIFSLFGCFPPHFFVLIYKDILMKKIVPTG